MSPASASKSSLTLVEKACDAVRADLGGAGHRAQVAQQEVGTRQFAPMTEKASSFSSPASYSLNGGMQRPSQNTSKLSISASCPPTSDMCETVPEEGDDFPAPEDGSQQDVVG